jgi:DNA-directed RNA polymerase subunit H (RpoH/RPB5)
MSAIFDDIVDKIEHLSAEERNLLLEKLKVKAESAPPPVSTEDEETQAKLRYREELIAKYVRPQPKTDEEYQEALRKMFTPEQIERLDKTDFMTLPPFKKPTSEMIIEDREDRL